MTRFTEIVATSAKVEKVIDVIALADAYLERFHHENVWALMRYDYLCEHRFQKNGWKFLFKRWDQVKKERAKTDK